MFSEKYSIKEKSMEFIHNFINNKTKTEVDFCLQDETIAAFLNIQVLSTLFTNIFSVFSKGKFQGIGCALTGDNDKSLRLKSESKFLLYNTQLLFLKNSIFHFQSDLIFFFAEYFSDTQFLRDLDKRKSSLYAVGNVICKCSDYRQITLFKKSQLYDVCCFQKNKLRSCQNRKPL